MATAGQMRAISGILQIIGLLVVLVAGYWIWYANWGPNPNDRIGTSIAPMLPAPFRDWGCGKLNQRFGGESPTVCSPVAADAAPPAPGAPDGSGRL
ncbi:hypothetical protein [Hansschlegelia sp.]|uniref:hypothetical protein n=1 Tax=Hansschlegelia sp. TaxID=2041892 RepID=UPI002B9F8B41|nr:hypothetical protein [Hansschlegelia sp.]HVI28495.1 hypothetical protein [Hansschlegelia sp.]